MRKIFSFTVFFIVINAFFLFSEKAPAQQLSEMEEAYQRAESMLGNNLRNKVFRMSLEVQQVDENHFIYKVDTRRGEEYFLVNVPSRTKEHAFDHEKLAGAIRAATAAFTSAWNLGIHSLEYFEELQTLRFEKNRYMLECSVKNYECNVIGEVNRPVPHSVLSPNGKLAAYRKADNLWVQVAETGEDIQLTTDGIEYFGYGTDNHGWRRSETPILKWSQDSKKIATFRQDDRDVGLMTLWRTETGRPVADKWPYALPGDSIVPMLERVIIDVENRNITFLDMERDHHRSSNCCGLIRANYWTDNEWSEDSSKLGFVSTSRDYKDVYLRLADISTGEVREVYHEHDDIFFESNLTSRGVPNWRILHDSGEFIWFSRKDNWGHLYLHDLETGELKNRITEGSWNVIDILHIDHEKRILFFTGVGREDGRDPYFIHLYRVHFDGTSLELLTPEDANHNVILSDDATWFADTFSTFTTPPRTVLRDTDGNLLMELEEGDIVDLLDTGWQKPVPVTVKARDGETDLYGIMLLPSNFDKTKKYPIINAIYPGPQSGSLGSRNFSVSYRMEAQALAELGFVVVAIDALGSSPMRSRDFHTYYAGNMADNGLPDQIYGMRQLAEKYPFIDLERAGIYGHSGGGYATAAAMLQYPEFFKVGVSSAGNHDNRGYTYYWGEKFQGMLENTNGEDNYENQALQLLAKNLEGKLLISYGTMDSNVHPSMTLLLINELIRHNKDFDLIVMPNRGHGYASDPYHIRRTWDYFVRHLAGKTPPKEYQLAR